MIALPEFSIIKPESSRNNLPCIKKLKLSELSACGPVCAGGTGRVAVSLAQVSVSRIAAATAQVAAKPASVRMLSAEWRRL